MIDSILPASQPLCKADPRSPWRAVAVTVLMTLAFSALTIGYGRYHLGSVSASLAYLRGARLLVVDAKMSTSAVAGGRVQLRYILMNWTGYPVEILGSTSSCTCTILEGLPTTLAASETKEVICTISLDKAESNLSGSIALFTDDPRTPEIRLAYSVRVEPPRPARPSEAAASHDRDGR